MVWLWLYILLGTVLTMPKPALGISYNLEAEANKTFACYSTTAEESPFSSQVIKLFLEWERLSVTCHLFDKNEVDNDRSRQKNLLLYTSVGLSPSMEIFNSTYSKIYYFGMVLEKEEANWTLVIPREDIAHNTDIAPTEQWYVKISMHHGLSMFTTEGTLLDFVREPILQWDFGYPTNISRFIPKLINITVSKSPCASDVAIIGLIFDGSVPGIYMGISWSGFASMDTYWCNFTNSICAVLENDCADLALLNVILTNTHIVFLTTLGLFISEDLRYGYFRDLKFHKPNFCGFEMDDYRSAKIWYNVQCLANQEYYEVDYVAISFNKEKTLSQESTCFYSHDPFTVWYSCFADRKTAEGLSSGRAVSFIVDYQQNTGIGLLIQQGRTLVTVNKLAKHKLRKMRKFPDFLFPDAQFEAYGMFFHQNSHFLYVYGNQVWLSEDGGNTFKRLIKLVNETVVKTEACVYTQAIIFVTDNGTVYYTKAGLYRYARLMSVKYRVFNVNFDHLGMLNLIRLGAHSVDVLIVRDMNVETLLKADDSSFDAPLSLQYISEQQVVFYSHVPLGPQLNPSTPRFYNLYIGKALEYSPGGSGIISKIFAGMTPPNFLSAVMVDVRERFPIESSTSSPCLLNTLTVLAPVPDSTAFRLQLDVSVTHIFKPSDVEKTIIIPGYSSFLIINVTDGRNALADATMPQLVPLGSSFQSGLWFMYDFGTRNGKRWKVIVDACRHTIQQFDDLPIHAIKYLDLGSTRSFSFQVTPVNAAFRVFRLVLLKVIVGRPNLLDVNAISYWDDYDSFQLKLRVHSRFFDQGKTSIALIVPQASLLCAVTTLILTLKNSCSYRKVMHYTLPVQLSASDWLLQRDNASKHLKNLPVNYRPPSRLGIAVPLTQNFYNADPEKPKMRDYVPESKSSGTYKQCANKSSRSECGCTDNMKLSFFVAFSDCKEKAIRMKYPVSRLPLHFTVQNEDGSVDLSSPYFVTITEVNNRTNWEISRTNVTSSLLKMRKYLKHRLNKTLYNPDGLTLTIHGSELFHFRVATIPGVSFCSLYDEFQIYVDDAPLAFPGQYLIRSMTAVLVGCIIFVAFFLEVYEIQMVVLWFYIVLGIVLTMPKLSSGMTYNLEAETHKSFSCYTTIFRDDDMIRGTIKLFLDMNELSITCHLFDKEGEDSEQNRRKHLVLYTSAGLAPTIEIFNSTYSKVFYFKMILEEDQFTWTLALPRQKIAHNTDIAPIEQWYVKFNMHHGFNMFTTKGTLLDIAREPVLQWEFSNPLNITTVIPNVRDMIVTKSPCASDVAIIGLILKNNVTGIYIGVSWSGFTTRDTSWYNLTDSVCDITDYDCADLSLLDVILTNTHIVFLTTLGIFISEDLRYGSFHELKFNKPNFCGFEMDDYMRAKIWYNVQCLANQENYEGQLACRENSNVDYISLSFAKDKTLSQESTCFYSDAPFAQWHSCLPRGRKNEKFVSRRVVSFLIDYQQNTGIGILVQQTLESDIVNLPRGLISRRKPYFFFKKGQLITFLSDDERKIGLKQGKASVTVKKLIDQKMNPKRKFPGFRFPDGQFRPYGMFFHPDSHFLYAYGNQVWFSEDGGNSFEMLIKLVHEIVVKTDACVYTQAVIFVTNKGSVFYTKAGLHRYAKLTHVNLDIFNMNFDHLGDLYRINLNETADDFLAVWTMNVKMLLQDDDLAFDGALAPQYLTEEQIMFFSHTPLNQRADPQQRFHDMYIGKALEYGIEGSGIINKVFEHSYSPKFLSSVIVDVLDRFPVETSARSPCVLNTLTVLPPDPGTTAFKLQLGASATHIFQATDIEKTVVIPRFSSFLIIAINNDLTALADATMPHRVPVNTVFQSRQWFLYDFGTTNGRSWRVVVDRCRYTIQQLDDLPIHAIKYLDLGSKRNFSFRVTPVNIAYPVFQMHLMEVIVGKPTLLDIDTEAYWDDTDSYIMKLHVQSRFFEQGKTSVAVIIPQASLVCDVTTIILTLKNSCSYLKVMHYTLPVQLSGSDWLSHKPKGSKHLKNLPVNYRPPSRLGIAIPITANFYNADPSKPKMRNYFKESKSSGIYKQCANKTSRSKCGCTDNMKLSFFVAFSDCKEKAIRMKYPVSKLPLSFTVENEDGSRNLSSPYFLTITEVNNRTNWEISGSGGEDLIIWMRFCNATNKTSSLLKMRTYLADKLNTTPYNPDGLTLTIYGSELFHFRVATIPGISFCCLFDEFQIYVDDAPLAFPGQSLISSITAVLVGFVIFVTFIMEAYEIKVWSVLKKKLKSKISLITISTASTEGGEK